MTWFIWNFAWYSSVHFETCTDKSSLIYTSRAGLTALFQRETECSIPEVDRMLPCRARHDVQFQRETKCSIPERDRMFNSRERHDVQFQRETGC